MLAYFLSLARKHPVVTWTVVVVTERDSGSEKWVNLDSSVTSEREDSNKARYRAVWVNWTV